MGYQVKDVCYATALQANTAAAAHEVGGIRQIGTASYVVDVTGVSATGITYTLRNVSSTAVVTTTELVTPQPCGMLEAADGLSLGWMVGGVWIAVFAVMFLTRGLRGSEGSSYGNP